MLGSRLVDKVSIHSRHLSSADCPLLTRLSRPRSFPISKSQRCEDVTCQAICHSTLRHVDRDIVQGRARERERDRACVHPGLKDLRPGSTWRAVNVERKRVAIAAQWGAHEVDDSR